MKTDSSASSNISCFRRGGNHLANKCTLDRNIKCKNFGTPGHLRKVCMATNRAATNQIEEVFVPEDIKHRDEFFKTLVVEGQDVRFEVDSGAAVSMISESTAQFLFPSKQPQPTTLRLVTFCKTQVQVIGVIPVSSLAWQYN